VARRPPVVTAVRARPGIPRHRKVVMVAMVAIRV
jgi:hypothetical protein